MKSKLLAIFSVILFLLLTLFLPPSSAWARTWDNSPGWDQSCTIADTPQNRERLKLEGRNCDSQNLSEKCYFGYDCKTAEDCKTTSQCASCAFCNWNLGVDPLDRYATNLKSQEMNVDQWLGGKMSEDGTVQTGGTIDSLMLKGLSLAIGVPDKNGNLSGGMMGIGAGMMASVYQYSPASSITYFADLFHNAGFTRTAYAQGVGFTGLEPILVIWKVFRNFAYLLITILFIILGIMIMFRIKLSPQTVISIQNAIPKIVITLILITFSYAIAGLLIDISNLVLVLVIRVLASANLLPADVTTSTWLNSDIGKVIGSTIGTLLAAIRYLFLAGWAGGAAVVAGGAVGAGGIAAIVAAILGGFGVALPAVAAGLALFAPAAIAILLGISFAIIGLIFRIFVMLVRAYISVILGVVIGPLQILFDALPGQKSSAFNSWIKNLLANVLVFPVVALLFILSVVFEHVITGSPQALWSPPTLAGNKEMVVLFIKVGILMIIPSVADFINAALAIKTPLGAAIGKSPLEKPFRFAKEGKAATYYNLFEKPNAPLAAQATPWGRMLKTFLTGKVG